jgi:hypothetical protein
VAERKVVEAADAQQIGQSDAEVASCWRTHRRRTASGAVDAESG